MLRRNVVLLALAFSSALAAAPVGARAADTLVAVLGIEASEGAPDAIAAALTDALRQRVSTTAGYKLVPGRDLVEVKLIFSCPDEAHACMSDAAKNLGAQKLLFGGVKKAAGGSYVVTLKLLDANRKQVDAWVAEQITQQQATGAAIRGPVQKWFATLTGQGSMGTIQVTGDVPGTSVTLDGSPVGVIGSAPLVLSSVPAGPHSLMGSKPGQEPVKLDVTVVAGESAQAHLMMSTGAATPAADGSPGAAAAVSAAATLSTRDGDRPAASAGKGKRTAGWVLVAAGVASAALGVYSSIQISNINADLDKYRRFECDKSRFGCIGSSTGTPATADLSANDKRVRDTYLSDGDFFTTLQWISYGAGAALAGTGVVLLILGYGEGSSSEESARNGGPSLSFAPLVTPTAQGATLGLRF
jgi:hypothetical protein